MEKLIVLLIIVCLLIGVSAAGYSYYGDGQSTQNQTQNQTQYHTQTQNQTMNQSCQNSSANTNQYQYNEREQYSIQSTGFAQQSQSTHQTKNQNGQNR